MTKSTKRAATPSPPEVADAHDVIRVHGAEVTGDAPAGLLLTRETDGS